MRYLLSTISILFLTCSAAAQPKQPFIFRDVGDEAGLFPHIGGIRGHGAAWGDIDGSGYPALFVNAFHDAGSKAAMLFRNTKGKFTLEPQEHVRTSGMGSGALFVDLTNNGKLDLYSSNCAMENKNPVRKIPSSLFRNDGDGKFTDVSKDSGAILPLYAGRGLSALDVDGDGLLDLLTCERYYGAVKHGPVLFRNLGKHQFANVSKETGLPPLFSGLGTAVADLNGDGWPDFILTDGDGSHRLYLNDGKGKFAEAPGSREVLQWKGLGKEDTPAGVCIGDVNNDGLPDIIIGHHTKTPWKTPVPIRLYLNKGVKAGVPKFEDVTEAAGLIALTMKAPHVEVHDFDNDGKPDILVSIVKFKDGQPHPIIFKNLGNKNGIPQFRADAWGINEFPTKENLAVKGTGPFFDKIVKDKQIIYMAPGPTADFDRDGRIDIFLPNWWIESRSLLLRNETPAGNWLMVNVVGSDGVNRMGVGSKIRVFPAGKLGDASALLGYREIAIGYGYCSGQEAIAHFGLGNEKRVDVEVTLPHGKGVVTRKNVEVNQRVSVSR
ncbi:MAG: CRTAC1 family protein [Gemmataceae bacterium]|nr:CRTAC1 family protein [Gemmataceae bacterium]